ncbi:Tyrosine recombinase XerA [uncultured archaeon]|nr:Tyrosine recombinase XerA [uncultured archaeon]
MDRKAVDIADGSQYPNERIVKDFLQDAQAQGIDKRTLQTYRSYLKFFMLQSKKSHNLVDKNDLKSFLLILKDRGLSPSSVNGYFAALNSFFDYLEEEKIIPVNFVPSFRRRYLKNILRDVKKDAYNSRRQLISVEKMRELINSTLDPRDRAIMVLLAKTGIRRNELINIDLEDIDWDIMSITLKKTPKRTNLIIYFDEECARVLKRWLKLREEINVDPKQRAVFINQENERLKRNGIYSMVIGYAKRIGIHNPKSKDINVRFTTHCFRHWFTTHLLSNGMSREFVSELRGDSLNETIDIYNHINKSDLREAYLAYIPKLYI